MYGEYREVVVGERVVRTEAYEGYDWEPLVVTTELEPDGVGTVLVVTISHPSGKIREADFPNIEHSVGIYSKLNAFLSSQ